MVKMKTSEKRKEERSARDAAERGQGMDLSGEGRRSRDPKRANVVGVDCACPDVGICKADLVQCNLCSAGLVPFLFFSLFISGWYCMLLTILYK